METQQQRKVRLQKARENSRKYRKDHREEVILKKRLYRRTHPGKKFKGNAIPLERYDEILVSQNGVCAICLKPSVERSLAVDHNHSNGKVRGLLCSSCNTALGFFKDNHNICFRAGEYLKKYEKMTPSN